MCVCIKGCVSLNAALWLDKTMTELLKGGWKHMHIKDRWKTKWQQNEEPLIVTHYPTEFCANDVFVIARVLVICKIRNCTLMYYTVHVTHGRLKSLVWLQEATWKSLFIRQRAKHGSLGKHGRLPHEELWCCLYVADAATHLWNDQTVAGRRSSCSAGSVGVVPRDTSVSQWP